jgi:hypothetical protein
MLRKLSDFQFLIFALVRLRRTAELASKVPLLAEGMKSALLKFDTALPHLKVMRDVIEHVDDYALNKGKNKNVKRRSVEVGGYDDTVFQWLGHELNAHEAMEAAQSLFKDMQAAQSFFSDGPPDFNRHGSLRAQGF